MLQIIARGKICFPNKAQNSIKFKKVQSRGIIFSLFVIISTESLLN